ncbi:unnamed protein product [Candidula unifasciata]|uniref:Uncharacterized protein n=1 Tax=Candidula unifasciata TaxID=100452 RepID=A0A8S3ZX78_9EUPU|nr:unnamed protein product [Candidula unifasciata]
MPKFDPTTKKGLVRVLPAQIDPLAGLALRETNPEPTEKRARHPPILKSKNPVPTPEYEIPEPEYDDEEIDPFAKARSSMQREGAIGDADYGRRVAGQRDPWLFSGGSNVRLLNSSNFYDSVVRMEKALVMFYNPSSPEDSIWARREFSEAANKPGPPNQVFASVDCSTNRDLCCREQATRNLPIFRLYSNGYQVSTSQHSYDLTANQMVTLVRMAPVLNQPRSKV